MHGAQQVESDSGHRIDLDTREVNLCVQGVSTQTAT
jgi:hypothetical protein